MAVREIKAFQQNAPPYRISNRCILCKAKSLTGTPIRDQIDSKKVAGDSDLEIIQWLTSNKVFVSPFQLNKHFKDHSNYLFLAKQEVSRKQLILKTGIDNQRREAETALDRIINIGDRMVENYQKRKFEGEPDNGEPELAITEKLYVEALREQGRRGSATTIDAMFEKMEEMAIDGIKKTAIDGQVVPVEPLPPPVVSPNQEIVELITKIKKMEEAEKNRPAPYVVSSKPTGLGKKRKK